MKMITIRKIVLGFTLLFVTLQASAMQVIMENGCPVAVEPGGAACPENRGNACVSKGATLRWSADGQIDEVFKKAGAAELHNCGARGPQDYQCIIKGNKGDFVDYGITVNGCTLDPRIIIR